MSTTQRIGFGKKIRLDWLALALRLRASGADFEAAKAPLSDLIAETNKGKVAITKALSNVRQVVFAPTEENEAFTTAALELYPEHGERYSLELVWGLSLVSYSFFALCAETTGRLLRLNESFTAAELVRRLTEKAGDRGFVDRVGRYNLSSILDWGVLKLDGHKKEYARGAARKVTQGDLAAWLLEAALKVSQKSALPTQQLTANQALFPFTLPILPTTSLPSLNPRLMVTRLSLNEELVGLRD
jgi:hypothetical protein